MAGSTLQYQWLYGNTSTNFGGSQTFTAPGTINGIFDTFQLTVSDTAIYLEFSYGSNYDPVAFNGMRLTDINGTIPAFTSVVLDTATNTTSLTQSRVSFDANNIYVNMSGMNYNGGQHYTLNVGAAPAPEPASWAMMLGGFGMLGGLLRSRRRDRTAVA